MPAAPAYDGTATYNASGGTTTQSGANVPGYGSYSYRPGESQDSFIMHNAEADARSPATAVNWMNPIGFGSRAVKGKSAYKRQSREYAQNMANYNAQLQQRAGENYQTQLGYQASEADRKQKNNLADLDAAFSSGDRQKARQSQYDASMGASLATLNKGAADTNRENALSLARRGVLGGSEDAEKQAGVQANYQHGVIDATTQAQQRQAQLNQSDADQYHALRTSILSGNPEEAAQTLAEAQRLTTDAEQQTQGWDFGTAHNQIQGQTANNTSQLIGGLGSGAADAYYASQDRVNRQNLANTYGGD